MLRINAIYIKADTPNGVYSFKSNFSNGLNIIRGNNTSGKSTLLNTMMYSLGMEEILGSRNETALPYALKNYIIDNGEKYTVINSSVFIEIINHENKTVTLRRSIKSEKRSPKLIEVIFGPYITDPSKKYYISPKYIHDPGSAQSQEAGYFMFLEKFLNFDIPLVPNNQSGENKLYIQTIFSALLIEQKNGWTDYIANIPYFRIRNAHQKIVEFLLAFNVFENERLRNELKNEIQNILNKWSMKVNQIKNQQLNNLIKVIGIPTSPDEHFDEKQVAISKSYNDNEIEIYQYLSELSKEYETITKEEDEIIKNNVKVDSIEKYEETVDEISNLTTSFRNLESIIQENIQLLENYNNTLVEIKNDIEKNRITLKIKNLGFDMDIETSKDHCPTCNQKITDSLIQNDNYKIMSIDENIDYLQSQHRMILKYINGLEEKIKSLESEKIFLKKHFNEKNKILSSLKKDMQSINNSILKSNILRKIQIENETDNINNAIDDIESIIEDLVKLNNKYNEFLRQYNDIPKEYLSSSDLKKLMLFQKYFKEYAELFNYKSTDVDTIKIGEEKYTPFMGDDTIRREIKSSSDIKSDSSASDFVRLIWSYIISLFSTSNTSNGNHPGIIIFDEPAQHSMSVDSFNSLLKLLSKNDSLQSIIGASFDESETVFKTATKDVKFNYIHITDKLLTKCH